MLAQKVLYLHCLAFHNTGRPAAEYTKRTIVSKKSASTSDSLGLILFIVCAVARRKKKKRP